MLSAFINTVIPKPSQTIETTKMTAAQLKNDALNALGSAEQLELLDVVDNLRQEGLNNFLSLPQIIVCGDQSSGKSSVLQAISGVPFPVKSSVCTRFPTELILRNTPTESVSVAIVPHHTRTDVEKEPVLKFNRSNKCLDSFAKVSGLIEEAQGVMGILSTARSFSEDILRIEINGPDRPHLTIVDLPGLVHSENKNQTTSDIGLISSVVEGYMKEPRSIILAVISAKNDYANQVIIKLARAADATGSRTLGIITKPDTLPSGSESEKMFLSLAKNQDVTFRLGWHVVRNADTDVAVWTPIERDAKEKAFFAMGAWKTLPPSQVGVKALRERLSVLLVGQIAREMPSLRDDIRVMIGDCQFELEKLGQARGTIETQRAYLINSSQTYQVLAKEAVDGVYSSPYFGDAMEELGLEKRLRGCVQRMNETFADDMRVHGRTTKVVPDGSKRSSTSEVYRSEFIDQIVTLIQIARGTELPGIYNSHVITQLFRKESQSWREIAEDHLDCTFDSAKTSLYHAINASTDMVTSEVIKQDIIDPALDALQKDLQERLDELLKSHHSGHPMTYNQEFIDTLQQIRGERRMSQYNVAIRKTFSITDDQMNAGTLKVYGNFQQLRKALMDDEGRDMKHFAAAEALDCLDAYYQVHTPLTRYIGCLTDNVTDCDEALHRRRGRRGHRGVPDRQASQHLLPDYRVRHEGGGHCAHRRRKGREPRQARAAADEAGNFEKGRRHVQGFYLQAGTG